MTSFNDVTTAEEIHAFQPSFQQNNYNSWFSIIIVYLLIVLACRKYKNKRKGCFINKFCMYLYLQNTWRVFLLKSNLFSILLYTFSNNNNNATTCYGINYFIFVVIILAVTKSNILI